MASRIKSWLLLPRNVASILSKISLEKYMIHLSAFFRGLLICQTLHYSIQSSKVVTRGPDMAKKITLMAEDDSVEELAKCLASIDDIGVHGPLKHS